jgi:hypothetical protein
LAWWIAGLVFALDTATVCFISCVAGDCLIYCTVDDLTCLATCTVYNCAVWLATSWVLFTSCALNHCTVCPITRGVYTKRGTVDFTLLIYSCVLWGWCVGTIWGVWRQFSLLRPNLYGFIVLSDHIRHYHI